MFRAGKVLEMTVGEEDYLVKHLKAAEYIEPEEKTKKAIKPKRNTLKAVKDE